VQADELASMLEWHADSDRLEEQRLPLWRQF
jgi:hypothetical protein